MFNVFRSREKSVRILLGVILGLVSLSMLAYLVPGGLGGPNVSGQNVIAAVGDEKVTTTDVQRALQNLTRGQANLPKNILALYVPSVVNQIIEAKAMAFKARQMGLQISDEELANAIQSEFSAETGGAFNMNLYQMVVSQEGMTVPDYEKQRREAMLGLRLENLEMQSLIVTDQEARAEYARKNLKVGLQYVQFDPKDFASKVNKDPGAVKAYFDKNRGLFRTPEKRDFNLIAGSTADFVQKANIPDGQLRRDYQDNIDSYRLPERVKVRHILIKTQGKPKEQAAQLKAKADDILKQLQHGANFAEVAKKNSEDPGSAEKGGELGWIVRGQTVPNFEKTAFSLKPGEMSGVIETEYGYHILQVEEKESGHTQSFDEVKPQLLAEAQKQAGADDLRKAVQAAHDEIVQHPSQADATAKKYGLKIFNVDNATTATALPDVNNQPELMNAIFAAAKGSVTDVVDIANQGKEAFAVVTNIAPAHNADYAEVQNDVLQKYVAAESEKLVEQAAKAAADSARKGEGLEAIAKQYNVTVKTAAPFTIDGAAEGIGAASLLSAAFKGNVGDIVGPVAAQSGQFVCRVSEKIPADMNKFAATKQGIVQELTQERQSVEQALFRDSVVSELRKHGKIKINQDALSRMISLYQS